VVSLRTITPNVWTLLQIRSMASIARLGEPSPILAVASSQSEATGNTHRINPLKTILRVSILTVIALVNRAIDTVGLGDSLMVELKRGKAP